MNKKILYTILVIIVIVGLYFTLPFFYPNTNKCPNDYSNNDAGYDQQVADIDKWTNSFYDKNPGATLTDWSKARYQYWVDNGCTEAIERYNQAKEGKAATSSMQQIRKGIQDAINESS